MERGSRWWRDEGAKRLGGVSGGCEGLRRWEREGGEWGEEEGSLGKGGNLDAMVRGCEGGGGSLACTARRTR